LNSLRILRKEIGAMRAHSFETLIFFVTGVCNARCHHCFYWENLGPANVGLPLDKIERVASSMPDFGTLLLSGGEPTLRSDLPQLVEIFRRKNHIRNVSIPTNGLLPKRIAATAEAVAKIDPELYVSFNLSIDGFADTHDKIRGVPGNYEKSLETMALIQELAQTYPNLRVYINTVICADNYDEVVPFARHMQELALADAQFFEIVRGDPPEVRMKAVPPDKLRAVYEGVLPIQEKYLSRDARRRRSGLLARWRQVSDIGNMINKYRHQWLVHANQAKWDFSCMAGEAIAAIDYNGNTRICELRNDNVNLADFDYDFEKAWNSATLRREASIAKSHACDCTHTCFLNVSMRQNFKARFWDAPRLYYQYKKGKLWRDDFIPDSYNPNAQSHVPAA
jgi:MoaA/NifB/PqqE/SkfB family radical SAM enzyme